MASGVASAAGVNVRLLVIVMVAMAGLVSGGSAQAATPTTFLLSGPANGTSTSNTSPAFTFGSDTPTATFECSFNFGINFDPCAGTVSVPGAPLSDGDHTFWVRAVDGVGGTDPIGASSTFTVDTVAPSLTIDSGPSGPTNDATPSFTFTPEALATAECRADADPFGACTGPAGFTTATLGEGAHSVEVRASDAAGNQATASRAFTVDLTSPASQVTGGPIGTTALTSPSFSFTVDDPGAQATCRFDSAPFASCTSPHAPAAPLADGAHQFDVRATDAAGNTGPVASRAFTVNPNAPVVLVTSGPAGDTGLKTPVFTFTAGPGTGVPLSAVECRFDADAFGLCTSATSHARQTPFADGAHSFEVRATNAVGVAASAIRAFTVHSGAPSASFTVSPAAPLTNETVTFTATSTDGDGQIIENSWDLDNDGRFDAPATTATRRFRTSGTYTVRLRATDEYGAVSIAQQAVVVANRLPTASFSVSPASVVAGQPVTLIATSTDTDGPTPQAAWDLTGNGAAFADASGGTVTWTFARAGSYPVRLRATDADGGADVASGTIAVAAAPAGGPPFLSPRAVIRIVGRNTPMGLSVSLLSVRAPSGASVEIRCTGRSCPARRYTRERGKSTVYRTFARRLRAGVVLEIRVTKPRTIGKYTRFLVRRNAAPARLDRCLMPGDRTPVRCPS